MENLSRLEQIRSQCQTEEAKYKACLAYVRRIAQNLNFDEFRRRTRNHPPGQFELQTAINGYSISKVMDSLGMTNVDLSLSLEWERYEGAWSKLRAKDQRIIFLYYIQGVSKEEIARELHIQPSSVAARACLAQNNFRKCLLEISGEDENGS